VTTEVSETGHRYQLMVRGECGPLTESLFGDAAIGTGDGCTSLIVSAETTANSTACSTGSRTLDSTWSPSTRSAVPKRVPHLPLRAVLAHPGASPLYDRGTPYPPVGSRGLATAAPAVVPETLKHWPCRPAAKRTVVAGLVRWLVRLRVAVVLGAARPASQRHMAHAPALAPGLACWFAGAR
jgi:hypothetical protein